MAPRSSRGGCRAAGASPGRLLEIDATAARRAFLDPLMVAVEPLHDADQVLRLRAASEPLTQARKPVALLVGLMARGGLLEVAPHVQRSPARRLARPLHAPVRGQALQQLRSPLRTVAAGQPEGRRRFEAGRRPTKVDAIHLTRSHMRPDGIADPAWAIFP